PRGERVVVGPVGELAPMVEVLAVDEPESAELHAELALLVAAHDGHGLPARLTDDLDRHRAESAGAAPHEHRIALADDVRRPAVEHAVRGGTDERRGRGFLPREVRGL